MNSGPVATFQVHEFLRPKVIYHPAEINSSLPFGSVFQAVAECPDPGSSVQLCDLYENDSIFDKFECCLSGDGIRVATGSYRYETLFTDGFSFVLTTT